MPRRFAVPTAMIQREARALQRRATVEYIFMLVLPSVFAAYVFGFAGLVAGEGTGRLAWFISTVTGWWPTDWDPVGAVAGLESTVIGAIFAVMLTRGATAEGTPAQAARLGVVDQAMSWSMRGVSIFVYAIALGVAGTDNAPWFVVALAAAGIALNTALANALGQRQWRMVTNIADTQARIMRYSDVLRELGPDRTSNLQLFIELLRRAGVVLAAMALVIVLPTTQDAQRTSAAWVALLVGAIPVASDVVFALTATFSADRRGRLCRPGMFNLATGVLMLAWPGALATQSQCLALVVLCEVIGLWLVRSRWLARGEDRGWSARLIAADRAMAEVQARRARDRLMAERTTNGALRMRPQVRRSRRSRRR